jgi:hypothetical protein
MGCYIPGPDTGKAAFLVANYGAEVIRVPPERYENVPDGKVLVVVVVNPPVNGFEAAAVACDKLEFVIKTAPDPRPRTYLLMDKVAVRRLSGCPHQWS